MHLEQMSHTAFLEGHFPAHPFSADYLDHLWSTFWLTEHNWQLVQGCDLREMQFETPGLEQGCKM